LADNGFDVGEAPRKGMQWSDIAVANRPQRHEAEIDQFVDKGEIVAHL